MFDSDVDYIKVGFNFLSFKMKAIILGIILVLFFLIIVPVLLISSAFSTQSESAGESDLTTDYTSDEIISEELLIKYSDAKFIIPFAQWDSSSGYITSKYGYRVHPVTGQRKKHTGIDLVSTSNNKIVAVEDGVVTLRTYNNGSSYGNGVEILHTLSDGTKIYTFYAHMKDETVKCKVGDNIKKGEVIGKMGSTGMSTGDHLHFEVRVESGYGNDIDPTPFIFGEIQ